MKNLFEKVNFEDISQMVIGAVIVDGFDKE